MAEHQIYAAMIYASVACGADASSMILMGVSPSMWQTQLFPSFRHLSNGDVVMIEAEPKFLGYCSQCVDTAFLRPLTANEDRILKTSEACFHRLFEMFKPGMPYIDLVGAWRSYASHDLRIGRTMGHGLGLGQDRPLIGPTFSDESDCVEEGECFVLKPWFSNNDDTVSGRVGGTIVVQDGKATRLGKAPLSPYEYSQ